jgi:DNA-directed RNA polymerase specialized sigma54-like protein
MTAPSERMKSYIEDKFEQNPLLEVPDQEVDAFSNRSSGPAFPILENNNHFD